MTGGTESQSGSTGDRPTSRVGAALWGSLVWGSTAWSGVRRRVAQGEPERGDVPGWVLVTLMTAGLVTALWVIAGDALGRVFEEAISGVTGP
ncbi:hypothetical protein CTE05_39900 [Cellulomonas terrae]|uniref:Uncharacterized protein n=1 Tax=Cellulomonas terrae TaxID=311234 RepID=A0A511JSI5_9CELL|nr:hypothetical protein CTE05_39900 [Cellulomonas terrae]